MSPFCVESAMLRSRDVAIVLKPQFMAWAILINLTVLHIQLTQNRMCNHEFFFISFEFINNSSSVVRVFCRSLAVGYLLDHGSLSSGYTPKEK